MSLFWYRALAYRTSFVRVLSLVQYSQAKCLRNLTRNVFFCKKEEETVVILIGIHLLCDFIACECFAASICYVTTNGFLKLLKKRISLHNSGLEDLKDKMGQGEVSEREGSSTVIQENKILTCLYNSWKMLQSAMSDLLLEMSNPSWKRKVTFAVTSRTGDKVQDF